MRHFKIFLVLILFISIQALAAPPQSFVSVVINIFQVNLELENLQPKKYLLRLNGTKLLKTSNAPTVEKMNQLRAQRELLLKELKELAVTAEIQETYRKLAIQSYMRDFEHLNNERIVAAEVYRANVEMGEKKDARFANQQTRLIDAQIKTLKKKIAAVEKLTFCDNTLGRLKR